MLSNRKQPLNRFMKTLFKEIGSEIACVARQCGLDKLAYPGIQNGRGCSTPSGQEQQQILRDVNGHINEAQKKITIARRQLGDEDIRATLDALNNATEEAREYLGSGDYLAALNVLKEAQSEFDISRRSRR